MALQYRFSLLVISFIAVGVMLPLLYAENSQAMAVPYGCCTTEADGGQCVGCPEGQPCNTSEAYCDEEGGFYEFNLLCDDSGGGASCIPPTSDIGCCVIETESCVDNTNRQQCFFGLEETPEIWVPGESCSNVPQCEIVRNVPTMSNWGLTILAGVFILLGAWAMTRKRAKA